MPKFKVNAEEYAALSDAHKEFYVADGDDFRLAADGMEDTGALKRGKERVQAERDEAKRERDELKARLDALEAEAAEKQHNKHKDNKDIEALENSWREKLDRTNATHTEAMGKLQRQIETLLVDNVATSLASEISTIPELLIPVIKGRLKVENEGDEPRTRILDRNGQPSASSIEDFKQELLANEKYAAILVGSKANGGGAGGKSGGGGATKKPSEMNEQERVDLYRTNPEKFKQLFPNAV